ncbi:MAG: hypothetical protein K0R24_41 [Gammaproteobacteria bacterium]|jgi:hypothetical protein|nr:hypothetical protein [Gammaproteobacteria bacterium]
MDILSESELIQIIEYGETQLVDFKSEHHGCKLTLLHDILCLANSSGYYDRYLIYGVSDKKDITGLSEKEREHVLINFVNSQKLNRKPQILLRDYIINGKEIQILSIENTRHKPYYLEEAYICNPEKCKKHKEKRILSAGAIYTRDGSTNTAKDRTASEIQIQEMWEERFGIRDDPLSRIKNYINDTRNWQRSPKDIHDEDRRAAFYKKYPEFTLELHEVKEPSHDFYEPWHNKEGRYPMPHELGLYKVMLKYHSTVLDFFEIINVEYKIIFPLPSYRASAPYYISKSSLVCKIASILDVGDDENRFDLYITYGLRDFLSVNSGEFCIELIE